MAINKCKQLGLAAFAMTLWVTMPRVYAGKYPLLAQMQIQNTCGTAYADKLATCTPFRCTKPGLMAMSLPSKQALKKMSPQQRQKLKAQMASAEKRLGKMSPEKRAQLKARAVSKFEIKGLDAQGRCQTITMANPKYRQDCVLDKSMRQRVSDYSRIAAKATDIEMKVTSHLVNGKMVTEQTDIIDGRSMSNPWQEALGNGQCKILKKIPGGGWELVDNKIHITGNSPSTQRNNTLPVQRQAKKSSGKSSNTLFILDASGSMWGQINGKAKITIAKEVMAKLVPELSDKTRIGLIAYGHRRKGDCNDVETLVKLAANDKQVVMKAVNGLNAKGKTPLSRSVKQAFKMLQAEQQPSTIILVSDGIESCNADPCEAVKAAKKAGIKFILHTVGFGLSKKQSAQLQCMAKAGGGEYFQANNAKDLLKSARKAVQPMGTLKLTVKVNGTVTSLGYRIKKAKTGQLIHETVLPAPSGASIRLSSGRYNVFVLPAGVSGAKEKQIEVVIQSGKIVKKTLSFGKGTLKLTVTVNGKPAHAGIHLEDPVSHKWIYQASVFGIDTPVNISLPAGKVDVVVQAGGRDIPEQRVEGVKITAGKTKGLIIPIVVKPITADAKGMEHNADRPGGALVRQFRPRNDDPALCQKACKDNAQCQSWTYVKPNTIQGPKPNCWLKSSTPPATRNSCCVSGVKAQAQR